MIARLKLLVAELRRRNVLKVASFYCITAWGATMGASSLLPAFGAPTWAVPAIVLLAVIGLPVTIVLAWFYDVRAIRVVRTSAPGAQDDAQVPLLAGPNDGTRLRHHSSSVHVTWDDARGRHDRYFSRGFRIGRDVDCEVHLDDPLTSRRHAEIQFADGLWWIVDLGSRNGTLLNGAHVSRAPLPSRCELRLHPHSAPLGIEIVSSPDAKTVTSSRIHLTNE